MLTITLNIDDNIVYETVITHNAALLFDDIGVYNALYHSEGREARNMIPVLESGIDKLEKGKREYGQHYLTGGTDYNYQGIMVFLTDLLANCKKYPESVIRTDK